MVNYLSTKRNQQQSVRIHVKAEHLQSFTTRHTTKHDFRWADPLYPSKHAHEYAQRLRCRETYARSLIGDNATMFPIDVQQSEVS